VAPGHAATPEGGGRAIWTVPAAVTVIYWALCKINAEVKESTLRADGWRIGLPVGLIFLGLVVCGCATSSHSYLTQERLETGLVISLDGIGGYDWGPRWLRTGLDEGGVLAAIMIYDWSKGPGGLFVGDLVDENRNHAAANDLARTIATYVAAMPNRPVTIIGHSGGAAVAVWALEALPKDCQVERAILLAPALAPTYNLSRALRAVRNRMYVMYSSADVGLLAAGTAVFGTMDRHHSVSAGLVGFEAPDNLTSEERCEYAKIRQVRWTLDLVRTGHLGGHMGWTTTRFAREFIAPILIEKSDPGEPLLRDVQPAAAGRTKGSG